VKNNEKFRLLIVDDELDARQELSKLINIKFEDVTLRDSGNGKDALKVINEWKPHVVISDIRMPFMDGLKLLELSRKTFPAIQFIIFTGRDDSEASIRALKLGASDYLQKPFTMEEMRIAIRQALERHKTAEQLAIYQQHLEDMVQERTAMLQESNEHLQIENTERRKVEKNLIQSQEQLRGLIIHLDSVREEERTRIAREIHDEFGQALTYMRIDLMWMKKRIPESLPFISEKVQSLIETVDQTIASVQKIATDLRPGILDDLGLLAALEWQVGEFQKHHDIKVDMSFKPPEMVVNPSHSTIIFRIFQEALTNIARHAKASLVKVRLKEKKGCLLLEVTDNGRGFPQSTVLDPSSLGFFGIRERILFFGGTLEIRSAEGKGATILASIPNKEREPNP
jgi:signal transduction histidine kinase